MLRHRVPLHLLRVLSGFALLAACLADPTVEEPQTSDGDDDDDNATGDDDDATGDDDDATGDDDDATGDDDDGATSGDGTPTPCEAWGLKGAACYPDYSAEELEEYCNDALEYAAGVGEGCKTAYEDYVVCLSELDCAELEADDPCPAEEAAVEIACDGGSDDTEDTGDTGNGD